MGLNTIETYVAWNAHEPRRGEWRADDGLDLGRFLDLVAAEGMHAIVRPGPYICAEWDNGGLPAWLFRDPEVGVRALGAALPRRGQRVPPSRVRDRRAAPDRRAADPVILVQIENEYGAYGSDKDYLAELVRVTREAGITVPLTTIDQPTPQMLADGSLPGLHVTGSFGSRAAERLATLREFQPTGPLMCMEFWCGWFDDWGVAPPHDGCRGIRCRARRAARRRRLGERLHVPRRHELRAHERRERQGTLRADHHELRLRRPARRERASHREVLGVPRGDREVRRRARRGAGRRGRRRPRSSAPLEPRPGAARGGRATSATRPRTTRVPTFDELGHDRGIARVRDAARPRRPGACSRSARRCATARGCSLDGVPVGVLVARRARARGGAARRPRRARDPRRGPGPRRLRHPHRRAQGPHRRRAPRRRASSRAGRRARRPRPRARRSRSSAVPTVPTAPASPSGPSLARG